MSLSNVIKKWREKITDDEKCNTVSILRRNAEDAEICDEASDAANESMFKLVDNIVIVG